MRKTRKVLSIVLALMMLVSCISTGSIKVSAESQRDAIVRIALAEEGVSGCPNKYTYAYGQIGGTYNWGWCAAFIYWCAQQAGISHSIIGRTASANVNSFNTPYYSYSSGSNVQKGDILYLLNNYGRHVGLVYAVDGTYIYTIEGNMGNAVKKYKYRRSDGYITWSNSSEWQRITHYGVPNYETGIQEPTSIIYPTSGATFKIASGVGNNMYLDYNISTNNIQIFEDTDEHSNPVWVKGQYFKLTHVRDGWYTITNYGTGLLVDVCDGNPASGTNIWLYEANGSDAQLFRFYDAGNGYCYIKSKLGTYVDVAYEINQNQANVWAHGFMGSVAQKWKLIKKDVPKFDTQKPSISNVKVTDINESGFTISCEVYDNVGIKQVLFPVWTSEALTPTSRPESGQDDLIYHKATLNGNTATCRINIADHNNSYGEYLCDPHIYDTSGNMLIIGRYYINVPRFVANCERLAPLGTYDVSKNDSIEICGWAFNLTGDKVDCYYKIDNGELIQFENLGRPDVPRVYESCKQTDCGYGTNLSASDFSEGTHNIKIIAKSNGAEQCIFENNFVVVKPTFTASFNANGGACSTSNKSVKCGNTYGNLPTPTRTGYTFDGWYTSATGGTKVTSSSKVAATSNHTLYAHWTCNHSSTELRNVATATCTSVGYSGDTFCKTCSKKIKNGTEIAKAPHTDTNSDKICDVCSEVLGSITPDTPEEPAIDCSCNCHKGGISAFFFKLILFFQRIFGMNKECKCGIAHY